MNRFFCLLCLLVLAAGLGMHTGCSRHHYRLKADREVYSTIWQRNYDSRWKADSPQIIPDATSRMFDPYHPDCEPMPCDDPAAHQKMHNVADKKGRPNWHDKGDTRHVENPCWRQYLLVNEKGEVPLDKEKAVELARLHAPEYQTILENLYLAAMNVSQERYRFDVQFFGDGFLNYGVAGGKDSTLQNNAAIRARRNLATGGNWAVELANSITWTFNGQGTWRTNSSLLNVSVVQPLLRAASRKVVLENLTQSERDFLAELRRLVLFQQGHYTRIVTGTAPRNTGVSAAGGGFYRLLADQIQMQNQRQNILGLEDNLDRFNAYFEAGQLNDNYQNVQMQQTLWNSQSSLLDQTNRYQSNVESYVSSLGLPPDLKVHINDPLLEQFQLTSPSLLDLMEDVTDFLTPIRKKGQPIPDSFRENIKNVVRRTEGEIAILEQDLVTLQKSVPERRASLKNLESRLVERIKQGERIAPDIYDTDVFEARITKLQTVDVPQNLSRLRATFVLLDLIAQSEEQELREMIRNRSFDEPTREALNLLVLNEPAEEPTTTDANRPARQRELATMTEQLKSLENMLENEDDLSPETQKDARKKAQRLRAQMIIVELRQKDEYRDWVRQVFSVFQYELMTLSMMQTRARLDAMTLAPISVTPEEAFRIASEHRLDWMNRKAQLVDTWRKIDIAADRLKGVFDLKLNGGLGTIDNRGVRFDSDTGHLDVRFEWESPLTRYNEMMAYRKSQIDYQKARRDYYTYVDSVQSDLRNTLRDVQMSQINFEISRNAVLVGTIRVDVMQLRMEQPPQRGAKIDTNTSQQLIDALNGLLDSQNKFLNTWVTYQTQRMLLDLYMGTMSLDDRGRWVEPDTMGMTGTTGSTASPDTLPPPELAPTLPIPTPETPKLNRRYVE